MGFQKWIPAITMLWLFHMQPSIFRCEKFTDLVCLWDKGLGVWAIYIYIYIYIYYIYIRN